jgi:hypothetical protein
MDSESLDSADGVFWLHTTCLIDSLSGELEDYHVVRSSAGGASNDSREILPVEQFLCDIIVLSTTQQDLFLAMPSKRILPCGQDNLLVVRDMFRNDTTVDSSRSSRVLPSLSFQMILSNCIVAIAKDNDDGDDVWRQTTISYPVDAAPESFEWTAVDHDDDSPLLHMTVTFNLTAAAAEHELARKEGGTTRNTDGVAVVSQPGLVQLVVVSIDDDKTQEMMIPYRANTLVRRDDEPNDQESADSTKTTTELGYMFEKRTSTTTTTSDFELFPSAMGGHHHQEQPHSSRSRPFVAYPRRPTTLDHYHYHNHNQLMLQRMIDKELYEMNCMLTVLAVLGFILVLLLLWTVMSIFHRISNSNDKQRIDTPTAPRRLHLSSPGSTTTNISLPRTLVVPTPTRPPVPPDNGNNTKSVGNDDISPLSLDPCFLEKTGHREDDNVLFLRRTPVVVSPDRFFGSETNIRSQQNRNERVRFNGSHLHLLERSKNNDHHLPSQPTTTANRGVGSTIEKRFVMRPVVLQKARRVDDYDESSLQLRSFDGHTTAPTRDHENYHPGCSIRSICSDTPGGGCDEENMAPRPRKQGVVQPLQAASARMGGSSFVEDYWGDG